MNELIPNAASLTFAHVHAGGRGGALVRADGEHALPEAATGAGSRRTDRARPRTRATKNPNTGLGTLPSTPRNGPYGPRSRPRSFGSGTGELEATAAPVGLSEDELLDRDGGGERHDREADTAHAQRRDGDQRPTHGGADARDQHAQREADPVVEAQVGDGEAGDAGEGELDDRDLPDEARDHDEREAHDRRRSAT